MKKVCIICRKEKSNFNDEHVIPDSINGFYHIKSVCTDCNSKMGSQIDNKLTNHKFIEFQRHALGIKGKSGTIPNPFRGTHVLRDNPDQKVQFVIEEDGTFVPYLLPSIPKEMTDKFSIIIDKKDKGKKDEIIEKFLSRNGISREMVHIDESQSNSDRPWIQATMKIDVENFKMAMLKIAYEFAVDKVPKYFDDPTAILYSKILETADYSEFKSSVKVIGNGMSNTFLTPFSNMIDFENNNHYLILFDSPEAGFWCFVNLFNVFTIGFRMSEKSSYLNDHLLIGKNDLDKKTFEILDIKSLVSQTYSPMEFQFQYYLPDQGSYKEFQENQSHSNFDFYRENDQVPFCNHKGEVVYPSIETKLLGMTNVTSLGDVKNQIITEYDIDEELYLKHLPNGKLYRVIKVRTEQHVRAKI